MMHPDNADSKVIWMDGKMLPYAEATVHVLAHSLHYGCAIFEGIRAYETTRGECAILRAEEHFQRFLDSMRALHYTCPYTTKDLTRVTAELIKANGFKSCYIRPLAYIDDTVRGLKMPKEPKARIAIAVWNWGKYLGDEGMTKGIRIAVSSFRRPDISTAMTWAKTSGNYLTSVLARREATQNGLDEALLLDPTGFVAEGSGENIFMVKNKKIYTPQKGFILPGITRDCAIRIAEDLGYEVQETNITRNQIYLADEVFFTGTAAEITPIREIDSRPIGEGKPGPITKQIADTFFKAVHGELDQYRSWLSAV